MVLKTIGLPDTFELVFGKRHQRTGLRDENGKPVRKIIIKHSPEPGVIYWEKGDEEDARPPDYEQKLQDLGEAYSKLKSTSPEGDVKKSKVAREMGISSRTLDRLFEEKDFLLVPIPGQEKRMRLARAKGVLHELETGPNGGVWMSLARDKAASNNEEATAAQEMEGFN
jgi:hypothetical protein